jgi:hypothetical protein
MAANSWTVELDHFTQYIIADGEPLLIPGGGKKATDCFAEFDIIDPLEAPLHKGGLPNRTRSCIDGDPLCDADASTTH